MSRFFDHVLLSYLTARFFDHQYLWKETTIVSDFLHRHVYQRKIASMSVGWVWPCMTSQTQTCLNLCLWKQKSFFLNTLCVISSYWLRDLVLQWWCFLVFFPGKIELFTIPENHAWDRTFDKTVHSIWVHKSRSKSNYVS